MTNEYQDARRVEAMRSSQGHSRGWDFAMIVDTAPWYVRLAEAVFNPKSLFALGMLGFSISLFWIA